MNSPLTIAIAYDFDGTLSPGNMQEHTFFNDFNITCHQTFWHDVHTFAQENNMDETLAYMYIMLQTAKKTNKPITAFMLKDYGAMLPFFPGILSWFSNINAYAQRFNITLEHYIISSGLKEIIEGTKIASAFKAIFASSFLYNQQGEAVWPSAAVNYTNKTQYIYRINKGILNNWDGTRLNAFYHAHERPIQKHHIIYIGDGETDIPAMRTIYNAGGHTIMVYDEKQEEDKKRATNLLHHKRCHTIAPANYTQESPLYQQIQQVIMRYAQDQTSS